MASFETRTATDHAAPFASRAELGDPEAQYELGLAYSTGDGVPVDLIEAHKWFNLAAMAGDEAAKSWRHELAGDMTRAEIAEAQRQAREWITSHKLH